MIEDLVLIVPSGTPGSPPLKLLLEDVAKIEQRKNEVAYVNKETAPELMTVFNSGYCSLLRMMGKVSLEYNKANQAANKRKAIVMLDVSPQILKDKGLTDKRSPTGSADLRKAILDLDDEYLKLQDNVFALEAVYEFLKGKAKGLEMSYHAVKKIYDVTNTTLGNYNNLNGGIEKY